MPVRKRFSVMTIVVFALFCLSSNFSLVASAANNPYAKNYNIIAAVNYATTWANSKNSEYNEINSWVGNDCTNFVSQCLAAGGVSIPKAYRKWEVYHFAYYNQMWTVAPKSYAYLKDTLGYYSEVANDNNIHIGDVIYYDWADTTSDVDHAAFCIGVNDYGKPLVVEHSGDNGKLVWSETNTKYNKVYVIHMTNAVGHTDVTKEYYDKAVYIKSLKNGCYVSSNTGDPNASSVVAVADRTQQQEWEKFCVVKNNSVSDYGGKVNKSISFRTNTNRYLSSYVGDSNANIKNTGNISTWEAFRIFRTGNGTEYILSLINGKFVQVCDDNKLYAQGQGGWSWESFDIGNFQQYSMSIQKSYTVQSSSGVKIRTGAGTGYSQVGGAAQGSVIKYTQTKSANGYTWLLIESGSTFKNGTWGSTTGYWIAML
ncbi:MAG: amidase domain-containing protein [Oscillospiraceae bacterium]